MSKTCEATHVVVAGHIYVYTWYSKNGLFCKDIFMHNNWIQFTYSVREGSLKKKSFPLHDVLIVRLWCTHSPTLLCLWQLVSCPPCRICCLGSSSLHLHWHAETQKPVKHWLYSDIRPLCFSLLLTFLCLRCYHWRPQCTTAPCCTTVFDPISCYGGRQDVMQLSDSVLCLRRFQHVLSPSDTGHAIKLHTIFVVTLLGTTPYLM